MLRFLGKGETLHKSERIIENLRFGSACPLSFVPSLPPKCTKSICCVRKFLSADLVNFGFLGLVRHFHRKQTQVGHGEVRLYRGTGVSRGVRRTTWDRSLKNWELQIPCFEEFFWGGNTLGLVPSSLPHTLGVGVRNRPCEMAALKIGACAMTTKFLDNKICTFKILLSWRFP